MVSDTFLMGTNNDSHIKYCGECPEHKVKLSTFLISSIQVTNQLFSIYKPSHSFSNGLFKPVTNISWYDAKMFCMWFDCRLLTEAEWEYASCKNKNTFWCCTENKLNDFAWYSENSEGEIHDTAQLQANNFGLFDMHGNVWEWVTDSYDENYYNTALLLNPKNKNSNIMKVCRGGSIHGFSEMCRSSFRYYEPAYYSAPDLGFRVAKS
jgi:formylglycine-generating enzyme required for sulfatase activity